jgi:8-oxo-dGTP pyrophosphatase MutT (NUDIX family)
MPYIPPHLRGGTATPMSMPNSRRPATVQRRKAIVIPKLHGRYVVVRHRNKNKPKGNVTFIGGGCRYGKNIGECALNELYEESRKAINRFNFRLTERNNLRFIGNRSKEGVTKETPGGFASTNRTPVVMTYHVFEGTPAKGVRFSNIRKRFHSVNTRGLSPKFLETSNIMLISKRNLMRMPASQKYFVVNKILQSNLGRHSVNSRFVRSALA